MSPADWLSMSPLSGAEPVSADTWAGVLLLTLFVLVVSVTPRSARSRQWRALTRGVSE